MTRTITKVSVKRVPVSIDFSKNQHDYDCMLLATIGWSTKAISDRTGLSANQVNYRLHRIEKKRKKGAGTQRKLYRDGKSSAAVTIVSFMLKHSASRANMVELMNKRKLLG